jgi:hypothetical protein
MTDHQASRTLVKSAPELWAECSDAASLARHLGRFGEIRITRLEPETAIAWEGEHVSGTVRLESSGWGTRVTLTARGTEPAMPAMPEDPPGAGARADEEPPGEVEQKAEPSLAGEESSADASPLAATKPAFLARLFGRRRRAPAAPPPGCKPEVEAVAEDGPPEVEAAREDGPPGVEAAGEDGPPGVEAAGEDGPPVEAAPAGQGGPGDQVGSSDADGPADRDAVDPPAVLALALESLGQAHHRPYSRNAVERAG